MPKPPHKEYSLDCSLSTRYRRLAAGELQRVMPGTLVASDVLVTEERLMALLTERQPAAVMNLISALRHHGLTTQITDALSVALPRGTRKPRVFDMPVQVWFTKPELLQDAAVTVCGEFGTYRVTGAERTLVDCFKYRNKIGLSVFLEALKLSRGKLNPSLLHAEAERLRVLKLMLPYLKIYYA